MRRHVRLSLRQRLAYAYLQDMRYAIGESEFLLGSADASCFSRAFRRWSGKSPRRFRSELTVVRAQIATSDM